MNEVGDAHDSRSTGDVFRYTCWNAVGLRAMGEVYPTANCARRFSLLGFLLGAASALLYET